MLGKIRVMIVDDAVVVRRLITDALSADPDIEVVGTAPNGRVALQKLPMLKPDVVTMDIEMPEMDGLETLTELRKTYTKLPVIMFSTLTERGGQATLEALARGATDYVTKPANVGSVTEGIARCRDELVPKIKWLAGRRPPPPPVAKVVVPLAVTAVKSGIPHVARPPRAARIEAIVIGISTGGPVALSKLIPQLPADLPVPMFVVQHMPPVFTRLLAERLQASSGVRVVEAHHGMKADRGNVYIAPGGHHMIVRRTGDALGTVVIELNIDPPECSCRPAVDVLFRSAARAYGSALLAGVLTGMGSDGTHGAQAIRAAGGQVIAQDEASSVVWGMPGSVVHAGLADEILPLERFAMTLTRRACAGRDSPPAESPGAVPKAVA